MPEAALTGSTLARLALTRLALLQGTALVLAFSFFGLAGDTLAFMSDWASLTAVVTALSLVLLVALVLVYGLVWLAVPRFRRAAPRLLGQLFITLVAADFFYFTLNLIDVKFLITMRAKSVLSRLAGGLSPEYLWLVLWAALVWWLWRRIGRAAGRDDLIGRGTVLAAVLAPASLALLVWLVWVRSPAGSRAAQPRHLVLLVLDGWPARYMSTYEPRAKLDTDPLFGRGRTFTNAHSTAVWTNGYFGTLYRGEPSSIFTHMDRLRMIWEESGDRQDNLLAALQRGDVRTRGLYYHRNGLPEGSSGRISNYAGFRSLFSRAEHAPAMHALGLDYFTVLRTPRMSLNLFNDARSALLARLLPFLEPRTEYDNVLTELLLPEMERIRDGSDRTLLIFHVSWYLGDLRLPKAWEDGDGSGRSESAGVRREGKGDGDDDLVRDIRGNDYRYPPEAEWYAAERRAEVVAGMARTQARLAAFLDEAEGRGLLEKAVILVTADHGQMFRDGRFWYGFHPDEEVTRVPLIAFGSGLRGIDDRLVDTPEISQTILGYFDVDARLQPRAISLLGRAEKPYSFTATRRSDVHSEWFVNLYRGGRAFRFNLHPEGETQALEMRIEGFDETPMRSGAAVLEEVPELHSVLDGLGLFALPAGALHPVFLAAPEVEGP